MEQIEKIKNLLAEGEYFQVIGVDRYAKRLEIETNSARLSEEHPELAGILSGITQVITDPDKHKIYALVCKHRDLVMQSLIERFGDDFLKAVPHCRRIIWSEYQTLLRCDFAKGSAQIGPRAAASIARRGQEWMIESITNHYLPLIQINENEKFTRRAIRTITTISCPQCENARQVSCEACEGAGRISARDEEESIPMFVDDFAKMDFGYNSEECSKCDGTGFIPCGCQDDYTFHMPRSVESGAVIIGDGQRTGKKNYAILERNVASPRPTWALLFIHYQYNLGKNLRWGESDFTLEEAEKMLDHVRMISLIGPLIFGACVGKLFESWKTGLVASIPLVIGLRINQKFIFRSKIRKISAVMTVLVPPALGYWVGFSLSSAQSGLMIGGVISGSVIALAVLSAITQKFFR